MIRQRAKKEGVILSAEQLEKLPGASDTYASLRSTLPSSSSDYILCARRIFLASVMVSSKFLQDRTFSNRAWSKISGLNVRELSIVERRLVTALEYDLNVSEQSWGVWTTFLRGEWKNCSSHALCSMRHSTPDHTLHGLTRKSLERTCSLQQGDVLDTDIALPSGDQHAYFAKDVSRAVSASSPCTQKEDFGLTTPTQSESTPTMTTSSRPAVGHFAKGGEQSLLSFALHNQVLGMDGMSALTTTDQIPLPFPLRKGLAVRSISTF